MRKVLMVLTSHRRLGDTGRDTGFYMEEMATPYWRLTDAGVAVELASIRGGRPPHDPASLADDVAERPTDVQRFLDDADAMAKLEATRPVAEVDASEFAGVFLAGGHGTMWDFPDDVGLARLLEGVWAHGGVIGAVCHGPAGLLGAKRPDGHPLVHGMRVNGFTNEEEEAAGLTSTVPFLLETRLRHLGGSYQSGPKFEPYAVRDGRLVTGQNPASSDQAAQLLLTALDAHVP